MNKPLNAQESLPKRVRRLGREYVAQFFADWKPTPRNKVAFAFERGYWAAWNEVAEKLEEIDEAPSDGDRDDLMDALLEEFLGEEEVAA